MDNAGADNAGLDIPGVESAAAAAPGEANPSTGSLIRASKEQAGEWWCKDKRQNVLFSTRNNMHLSS